LYQRQLLGVGLKLNQNLKKGRKENKIMATKSNYNEELLAATRDSDMRKDGDVNIKYFDPNLELSFWRPQATKEEPHIFEIIPFVIGSKPTKILAGKSGKWWYILDVKVHQNIGPGKMDLLCPAFNYGLPCPICEDIDNMDRQGRDYEEYANIALKRRCVYNVWVITNAKEESRGARIWEVSHRYSEKAILSIARNPRTGGVIPFASPDKDMGKSIIIEVDSDVYRTVRGHRFADRLEDIPEHIKKQARPLDEIVIIQPYDFIREAYFGRQVDAEDDKGKTDIKDFDPIQEEAPQTTKTEEAIRTEAPRRSRRGAAENPCPFGKQFGIDSGKFPECERCEDSKYKECCEKADMIALEKKKSEEAATRTAPAEGRRLLRRT
jgi:hypothetical protein